MIDPLCEVIRDHEALMQFLYLAPVGLLQASIDGEIAIINPVAAQLLMPLALDASLVNLYDTFRDVVPDLGRRVADFAATQGTVCDALRIPLPLPGSAGPQVLSLTLLKLDEHRIMAMISDVTDAVWRERLLQHNDAWFDALLTGATDYAVILLDGAGRIHEWNPGIGHVTGFDASAAGRSCTIFYPSEGDPQDRLTDRLREADAQGWSLDDGWRVRADGGRYWASAMISPLRSTPHDHVRVPTDGIATAEVPAYHLVIRDLTARWAATGSDHTATTCDALTGIADRSACFAAIDSAMTRGRRSGRSVSLAFLEVDDFDALVAREGRGGGDAVLRHVASMLASTFRQVDVPARIGDARFAVLLSSPVVPGASVVAGRLQCSLPARPLVIGCSISVGVVTVDAAITDHAALMRLGSAALAASRATHADRVEFGVAYGCETEHLS